MDETQRSAAGSNSSSMRFSIQNEGDPSIDRLAPVSVKGSQQINKVFHELIDHWKTYTAMEDGDRIASILQNYSVEKQLEQLSEMQKNEILDIVRFNLRKTTTLQEENDQLTRRNREISEKLHRIEHRVGKAQVKVFDKVQETTMEILKEFHAKELELARKVEALEAEKADLAARNSRLDGKIEEFERKTSSLEAKIKRLTELNDENEKRVGELTVKNESQEDEIFHLREQLEKANELAREKTEEALQEAVESQRVKTLILKERETANIEAARHQEKLVREMDRYKSDLERDLTIRHQRHKKEVDALNAKYEAEMNHKDAVIEHLTTENKQKQAEISKFTRHFAMMEAQIKGNMKRRIALSYQEMLDVVSSGPSRLPTPPYENPFLERDKENSRNRGRSPSPKRTLGVQTADVMAAPAAPKPRQPRQPEVQQKTTKFSSSVSAGRVRSTSLRR